MKPLRVRKKSGLSDCSPVGKVLLFLSSVNGLMAKVLPSMECDGSCQAAEESRNLDGDLFSVGAHSDGPARLKVICAFLEEIKGEERNGDDRGDISLPLFLGSCSKWGLNSKGIIS
jgi:hypothetical protein